MIIGNKQIGADHPVYIIAEVSSNHCRDYRSATQLIRDAAQAGADAVKFQTFEADELIAPDVCIPEGYSVDIDARLAQLQTRKMRALFKDGGLPRRWHARLKRVADAHGIEFLSTPFSVEAARFLVEDIGVNALKIASGDLTYPPLLNYAASTCLPIILSTGGATYSEIVSEIHTRLHSAYRQGLIALLHCRSVYPCPVTCIGIRGIHTLKALFTHAACGLSDHSTSIDIVPALAVQEGAQVYEKHIRPVEMGWSSDAAHSITPGRFQKMVEVIRSVPKILGDGSLELLPHEAHDRLWARRSPQDWLRPTEEARAGRWE